MYGDAGVYQIERSLRFNSSDSASLSRASYAGSGTFSCWVKRCKLGTAQTIISGIAFNASDQLNSSTAVFRDPSAWMHVLVSTSGTYVNGTSVASGSAITPGIIGSGCDLYLADIHFIDGQALTPSSFTEVSATTGQLIPKAYSGTYGTNGFYLKFADNSTTAALGTDSSGNGNTWTPNNFSVVAGNGNFARYVYAGNATYNGSETGTSYYTGAGSQYNGFDGNTSTYVGGQNVGASWVYFRPGTAISGVSQVRVYTAYVEQIYINGSLVSLSPSAPSTTAQWYSVTSPASTINEIAVQGRVADNSAGRFSAIEINGVVLVDNSFGSGNDSLVDTPTSYGTDDGLGGSVRGNYATLNPLTSSGGTYSQGNLRFVGPTDWRRSNGTIAVSTGKWYWEVTLANGPYSPRTSSSPWNAFGFGLSSVSHSTTPSSAVTDAVVLKDNGYFNNFSSSVTDVGTAFSSGDVLSCAVDLDANTFTFRLNNTQVATGTIGGTAGRELVPIIISYNDQYGVMDCNFGQRPFAYTAPSGFKALCDTNLPAPVVAKGSSVMDVKLYTGNGSTQTISGLGFSPDLVWIKARSTSSYNHFLLDTIRGVNNELNSNTTDFEYTRPAPGSLTAFNSDGFNLNTAIGVNASSTTYAAWCWDAGTSTVTNTQGSITSQVRANVSAGFSVVTYTPTSNWTSNANATVGHGLGVKPALIIAKNRDRSVYWSVYHSSLGAANWLRLNTTDAAVTTTVWGNPAVEPTSTVFTFGDDFSVGYYANEKIVAYCFAPVTGYSSFGSYTGNGSSDGPFVYTGFRPRWVMLKQSSGSGTGWQIHDTSRNTYNVMNNRLQPSNSDAESTYTTSDFLSNGFKLRDSDPSWNGNGATYIYAAFAENPFQFSRAR